MNQATIRIGRGARCDISLPVKQFPNVNPDHAELEVVDGTVRVAPRDASQGDLYLNDEPAQTGDVILSGDVLRLGGNGPELRIGYTQEAPAASGYMPTRVISVNDVPVPGREATRLMSDPGSTVEAPARPPMKATSVRPPAPEPVAKPIQAAPPPSSQPIVQPVRPGGGALGSFAEPGNRWPASAKTTPAPGIPVKAVTPPSGSASSMSDPDLLAKLRNLQIMQGVSLAIILLLGIWAFQLRSEVTESHSEIRALRSQDQNALASVTPSLDARLNGFSQRMDAMDAMFQESQKKMEQGLDAKMKLAEEQLFVNLDAHMKQTEDHMVTRMNTDLPPLLDNYLKTKMLEVKH
jgi:hypothetical protein